MPRVLEVESGFADVFGAGRGSGRDPLGARDAEALRRSGEQALVNIDDALVQGHIDWLTATASGSFAPGPELDAALGAYHQRERARPGSELGQALGQALTGALKLLPGARPRADYDRWLASMGLVALSDREWEIVGWGTGCWPAGLGELSDSADVQAAVCGRCRAGLSFALARRTLGHWLWWRCARAQARMLRELDREAFEELCARCGSERRLRRALRQLQHIHWEWAWQEALIRSDSGAPRAEAARALLDRIERELDL